jgi:hypothetical protein
MFVNLDAVIRWDHLLAGIDRAQSLAGIWVNKTELELRHARQLIARFLNLSRVETGNLDQNPIAADRTNNWLPSTKVIDALANDLDCLVEHAFIDRLVSANEPDEKRSAALNIETERDLFLRRPDRDDAERHEQEHQRGCKQAFPQALVGREIPPEEDEQDESNEKCKRRTHSISDFGFRISDLSAIRFSIVDIVISSRF